MKLVTREKVSNPHPAGEGLRWIAHGFSALGLSYHEILTREFIVYDALYRECQKRVGAKAWPLRPFCRHSF